MTEKKEKDGGKSESPKPISRREFTKGSMAVLGAYSSLPEWNAPPPLSPAAKEMKLQVAGNIQSLLDERHIVEEDLKRVIEHGERTGLKLYQPGKDVFLSKLRINQALFYVEYSPEKEAFRIHTAYTHRFTLEGE
jgi:hypothetical protein